MRQTLKDSEMQTKQSKIVKPIFIDLETKSAEPIEHGPTRYFADKSADWLICAVVDSLGISHIQTNYAGGKKISPKVLNHKGLFVAHNWFFEWSFFNQFYPGTRAADYRNWMCTAALARWFGICAPRAKLEDVAAAFDLEKMPEGKSLIARYTIPQKDGSFNVCEAGSDDAILFEKYCLKDTELSKVIYEKLDGKGLVVEEFRAAQAIDVRGVPIDTKAAQFLLKRKETDKREAFAKAEAIAGRTAGGALVLSASGAFIDYIKKTFGLDLPDARAGTLDAIDFSTHPDADKIENVLYIRKLLTARAGDKAEAILDRVHNDRVRSATVFHAAGTGRFQSWGVNFFNFSRQTIIGTWEKNKNTAPVPALQRGMVCAPKGKILIESDWRGIENYLSLYYAGDIEQLERIENGESPYLIFAEKLYGETITKADKRYVPAKSAVLGCGYGAGYTKLALIYRLDINVAKQLHAGWRKINQKIVQMWYDFQYGFNAAAIGRITTEVRSFLFEPLGGKDDNDVKITLQDGHVLYYRGLEVHYDAKNRVQILRDGKTLHGGLITENLMQATCARLLYKALAACEKAGLSVVLHIYDSIMIESEIKNAKRDAVRLAEIMRDAPPWAPDLCLAVDLHTGKRWTK
jgi:DNA polymerase bacteriophage-type